ncbi:hypothetical protein OC25_03640 [Pedobacter kyungheensis]|uniref:Uncharacterized protein n=2 Tax=Pedobacter TaxID=84567 RepID=A0A1G6JYZ3_9SPHI|nr:MULTISPECIES: hypothetical protein [Pedobacter]KIA96187.1 hypothetical protein OC25_03640 [Pedobacter kyungheensis]SDC23927.1 hypothetical protein SAMN04488024_101600 [Pedobacter soli]
MKRVSNIGIHIPSNDENYIRLDSISSLSETDIAIFSPDLDSTAYSSYDSHYSRGVYEGKTLYNKDSSSKILDHTKHWQSELLHFVENGGTLVVVLCKKQDFYIYSGTKSTSGTGRNQKTTEHVAPFTNYNLLPFSSVDFASASGKTVYPNSSLVTELHNNFKDYFSFETYIKSDVIGKGSTFTTKNKDRVLGAALTLKKGFLVFLPNVDFEIDKLTQYNSKTDKTSWNSEGIKLGKLFLNSLVQIDKVLHQKQDKTPKPNWLSETAYGLHSSTATQTKISKLTEEILRKKKEIADLRNELAEQDSLKDLLFETGKPLEKAVIKALIILGYKAENYDDGELELDQIIISPEGERLIGECEGKDSKDIDVSKFRQLLDGLNADFEKEEVKERASGLLFGNPQRLTSPNERTLSFTAKCQTGAKREQIGLVKTADLFLVCKHILESGDQHFAKTCRESISLQLGEIVKFPEIE